MKAVVYRGPYKVRIENKAVPAIEHPNDAIVRVQMAAICGPDVHRHRRSGRPLGAQRRTWGPGDGAVQHLLRIVYFCTRGPLSNCRNVNPNATAVGGSYGYSHTFGGYDGGQSEYVRVPFADVGPSLIPDWLDDEDALLCTDALATGYFVAQLGDIVEGDTVVVFGAGPVGLFADCIKPVIVINPS
jgi:threonine dehydrogenase-like Zn-dependent dehydrogenase